VRVIWSEAVRTTIRFLLIALGTAVLASPVLVATAAPVRAEEPPLPVPRPDTLPGTLPPDLAAWRTTLTFAARGEFDQALAVSGHAPIQELRNVMTWTMLREGFGATDYRTVAGFLSSHPDWPGLAPLRTRAEVLMPEGLPADQALAYFDANPPRTSTGRLKLLSALERAGRDQRLTGAVRDAWHDIELSKDAEEKFLDRYGDRLTAQDHVIRLDRMLWRGHAGAARHQMDRVSEDWRLLADARLRLRFSKSGVDGAINAVPEALQGDPGLIYERIRWRRKRGMDVGARDLLLSGNPVEPEFAALLWRERAIQIREAIEAKAFDDAYLLAAGHNQTQGIGFADGEWLAGWIALRFLSDPEKAFRHFTVMHGNVGTPISRSRGAYWAGRAAEELRDRAAIETWYGRAAEHGTTFYGQLAAGRLGQGGPELTLDAWPSAEQARAFRNRDLVRTAMALRSLRMDDLAERFLLTLTVRLDDPVDAILLAELAREKGLPKIAVFTARRAARMGASLIERGYPTLALDPGSVPEPALVHAIIRQESSFDPRAISRVGARGLMQLMPATARQTAASIGEGYDLGSLLTDPGYNITLGRTYLRQMLERFEGNYVMAIAAYNAGPHRVDQWIRRNGDPRDPGVDIIDWIELIPFSETRNYVQRVLEAVQVYRTRLSAPPTATLVSAREPTGPRAVWCVFDCGTRLDG